MAILSIIVPIYNAEKYIRRCIESLVDQTYGNIEVILIDDGSTDNSRAICETYKEKHDNIKLVTQKNAGPGPARNKGIELASGDYIGFVDADDFIHKDMYFHMMDEALKNDVDIVQCGYFITDESGNVLKKKILTDTQYVIKGSYNCLFEYVKQKKLNNFLCNKIIKRELFRDVAIPSLFASEDQCTLTQLFYNCNATLILPEAYYYYVMSPQSLVRDTFNVKRLDGIKGGKMMYEFHKGRYKDLACFSSLNICSNIARCYAFIDHSDIENKEAIKSEMLSDFYYHYKLSKNSPAINYASRNRKWLLRIFNFSPWLSSILCRLMLRNNY